MFEWLRPHHSVHKTNTELEVGRKVVLSWMVERTWTSDGWRVVYGQEQKLTALENVFYALDGRGQISKGYYSALQNAIGASKTGTGETPLFKFKCFKNKNMHLEFTGRTSLPGSTRLPEALGCGLRGSDAA